MTRLEQALAQLKARTLEMGALAQTMVETASRALVERDEALVDRVLAMEPMLDASQVDIDREAIRLITVHAPVARQLRFLLMIARIDTELERIGDQAVNNCEYARLLASHPPPQPIEAITRMSRTASRMLQDALQALRDEDATRARAIMRMDDEMDDLDAQVLREVLAHQMSEHEIATRCLGALVARSLERIADHATNICEEIYYLVEGEDIRHQT